MKKFMAIAIAVCIGLCALSTFASGRSFSCKEVADNARDHRILLKLSPTSASLVNFMGDGRDDRGSLKSSKKNGDYIFKGFPHWVDSGVPESGYLFVPAKLLKSGKGMAMLYSRGCDKEGSCATRSTKLSCKL